MKVSWQKAKEEKGILVAFDATLQPLILWWYQNLRKYSLLPIAFVDLGGISNKVKNWCKKNGYYINCEKYPLYFKKIKTPEKNIKKWLQEMEGDWKAIRHLWFAKPFAMMHTPFEETLYLDVDCEIKSSIDEIFSCLEENEMGLGRNVKPQNSSKNNEELITIFNSGVIVYKHKSEIIEKWIEESLVESCNFMTDQDILSYVIDKYKYNPEILPMIWNWSGIYPENNLIKILHWCGESKFFLVKKILEDKQLIKDIKKLLNRKELF